MYHGQSKLPYHPSIKNKIKKDKQNDSEEQENSQQIIVKRMNIDFDSLFWIFYYIYEGEDKYILHKNDFKEKQKIIYNILENISKYKPIFSRYSYYKKNKMIENLTNIDHNDINLLEFSFMCSIHDIIILVKNKQFFYTNYPNFTENMNIETDELDLCVKKFIMIDESEKQIKTLT